MLPPGTDRCKCTLCGKYFNSTSAFDKHKVGKIGTTTRRCKTESEMLQGGMVTNKTGHWTRGKNPLYS